MHKHCLQFHLEPFWLETEDMNAYADILEWLTKSIMVCYGIFCSGQYGHLMKLKEIKDLYALRH